MDATTTSIDDIEVIPTRTAVAEAPKRYTWKFPIKPEQTVNTTTNELVKWQQMKLNAQMQTEMLNVLKELRGKQSSDK
jgi:hypothetical protein